ncbi:MAG: exodeoxyribonuclease V subunit beta [Desulfobacteraceae bacterium]|nr:exodeoxyribonuclease V subunit beta [Desulfobacteraceae bacterium]
MEIFANEQIAKRSHFNLSESELKGTNLIEASAGTGKTYTITGLFLRLILEKKLPVNEILVVTFTKAATAELKDRIRKMLRQAAEAFTQGKTDDSFLNSLIEKEHDNLENSAARLKTAIRDFDEAAIFTIHGFCQRMLQDNAFESGSPFDSELVTEQDNLKREIVEDFWRRHFYKASPVFVNYVIAKTSPDDLVSLLGNKVFQTGLKVIPNFKKELSEPDSSEQETQFKKAFNAVAEAWSQSNREIKEILLNDTGLNRTRYNRKSIPGWIREMDDFASSGNNNPAVFEKFAKFTSRELENSVKKGHIAPDHTFFNLCEDLKDKQAYLEKVFEKRLLRLKTRLFKYVQDELKKRKQANNTLSFDDLLFNLFTALGKYGTLAEQIRDKFKAALIDEFQDTDPVQYAIFKKIFDTRDNILFLIGDPKQAIYGFRGADIFAYMDAARHADTPYTLGQNWRSEPNLIKAVNSVFEKSDHAFVYDEIPFEKVEPAERKDIEFLTVDDNSQAPLQLWFLNAEKLAGNEKPLRKSLAQKLIIKAVAAEISRLVFLGKNNKAMLGDKPLRESDIAVLVRKNQEALMIQNALLDYNIPGVLYNTGNVFESCEALELERILDGIARPNSEKFLKAALATEIMGVTGEELDNLSKDETVWEQWLVRFREYHELWNRYGFIRMFRQMMSQEQILARLMKLPGGERRNTNLLHLAEILHQVSVEKKAGMAWLVKWLSEQKNNSEHTEERQLRLESDENAVKLVTIHKSKGLEYPVVFCPFTWESSKVRDAKDPVLFHDDNDNRKLTLDLGSEEKDRNSALTEKELLAENLRLLYVAMTRAKNRCYLTWGRINKAETSAPAYLFHYQGNTSDQENIISATAERFAGLTDSDVWEQLKTVCDKSDGAAELSELPDKPGIQHSPADEDEIILKCRNFYGKIDKSFCISSFSSLTSRRPHTPELADYDARTEEQEPGEDGSVPVSASHDIFSFPKGAKAGTFLHDIFEHLDFTEKDESVMEQLVSEKLGEYDFDSIWQKTVCDAVQKTISVPLIQGQDDFTLSQVPNKDRLNELEFYFPLNPVSAADLKNIFSEFAKPDLSEDFPHLIGQLIFSPVQGFMKGFIDMIFQFQGRFYLADWKSNFLGAKTEDYNQGALAATMKDNYYILQYHIYTVALDQYLRVRIPDYNYDTHFGGVYYIFLRGTEPEKGPEFGIYMDKPPAELVEELSRSLISRNRHPGPDIYFPV